MNTFKRLCLLSVFLFCTNSFGAASLESVLKGTPKNWNKWGKNDNTGALHYLDKAQTLRGIKAVQSGERFTLQIPMVHGIGPVFPGRIPVMHYMTQDESTFYFEKKKPLDGGVKYSDDVVFMYLQGTTHTDALGHAWYGDYVYGGKPAKTTVDGHSAVDVAAIGEVGITGRAVLVDVGHFLGDKNGRLAPNSCITLKDINKVLKKQKTSVEKRDILIIRTGSMGRFYDEKDKKNWNATTEPGLCYSKELVKWIRDMEIPMIGSDNLAIEKAFHKVNDDVMGIPLHGALIRDLGVVLTELLWLEDISKSSVKDGQYTFFYAAAPLKMKGGSGSPTNPIAIK